LRNCNVNFIFMTLSQLYHQHYPQFAKLIPDSKITELLALNNVESAELDFDYLMQVSSVFSSKIEGNSLDLNSYFNTKDLATKVKSKEITEIQDLTKAYKFAQNNPLTLQNFLHAHTILSKTFLPKANQGKIRTTPVGVFGVQGLIYMAVESENVKAELEILFNEVEQVKKLKLTTLEAIFWASLIHLRVAQIHPFVDGNGRIARLIEKWFLTKTIGQSIWGYQPEKYYWDNRSEYYSRINLGQDYYNLDHSKAVTFAQLVLQAYLSQICIPKNITKVFDWITEFGNAEIGV
jgi:Fic family protein